MSDTRLIDTLNDCLRFDPCGRIEWMDEPRARAQVAQMRQRRLAREFDRCLSAGDFSGNRLLAASDIKRRSGLIAGLMSTPYVKDSADRRIVSLQAFSFRDLDTLSALQDAYPAPAVRPVSLISSTARIRDTLRFVAFFPDSLIGELPEGYADGIYFCAKFVEAFETRVRPLLDGLWTPDAFAALRAASTDELHRAAAIWVHLHEHHHCASPLPIADLPVLKGSRLSGAFEELRVDLLAMLTDVAAVLGPRMGEIAFEFILAFRLIYYGSCFDPARDYDAITSVALANTLARREVVAETGGRFALADPGRLRAGLQESLAILSRCEARLADTMRASADAALQRQKRAVLEALMLDLCGAGVGAGVERAPFHVRHSAMLTTESFAAG